MRKLATVRIIDEINPIEGADAIECATIGGWKIVSQKGIYVPGELCVYLEIDSWVPTEIAPFLTKPGHPVRVYNGVQGERLKTIRLRGQVSQGLLLPMSVLPSDQTFADGDDVTEILGIQKWEAALHASLGGNARGNFPSFIFKTDQERIQNMKKEFSNWKEAGRVFEVTEKVDGSSMTVYLNDGVFGVCSRNLDLIETSDNTFWKVARQYNLEEIMRNFEFSVHNIEGRPVPKNFAIQGELLGPGVQKNKYNLKDHALLVFDIFDIDNQEYFTHYDRWNAVRDNGLFHVPLIPGVKIFNMFDNISDVLSYAEMETSLVSSVVPHLVANNNPVLPEGIVFKDMHDGNISCKAISTRWLLANDG